jgi:flagellar basal body L-ring protein FlgH
MNCFGLIGSWTDSSCTKIGGDRSDTDGKGLAAVHRFRRAPRSELAPPQSVQYWRNSDSSLSGALRASKGNDLVYVRIQVWL